MLDGISKVVFQEEHFIQQPISLITLYRSPNSSKTTCYWQDVIGEFAPEKIDIIFGEFNVNASDDENFQTQKVILNSYEKVLREPTYVDGGC